MKALILVNVNMVSCTMW